MFLYGTVGSNPTPSALNYNTMILEGKSFGSVRECVKFLNANRVSKEKIVNILSHEGLIFAIWYKDDGNN